MGTEEFNSSMSRLSLSEFIHYIFYLKSDASLLNKNDDDIEIIEVIENKKAEEQVVDQYKYLIDDLLDERNDFN